MAKALIIVPTYNEAENVRGIAEKLLEALPVADVLFVDDNSPDGTGEIADSLAREMPRLGVIHRVAKAGLGRAYAAGFDRALEEGARVVIEMDADFSHNPMDLPRLVAAIDDGADLAIGSRYVPGGATPDWPLHRRLISKAGNLYARAMLGIPIRDATAGFRAYRAEALRALPYRDARASGYGFQVEMAWRAYQAGFDIREVPIVFRDREQGKSKMGTGIVLEAMWLVTKWGVARRFGSVP